MVQPTHLKNTLVKLEIFPQIGVKIGNKYLKPPASEVCFFQSPSTCFSFNCKQSQRLSIESIFICIERIFFCVEFPLFSSCSGKREKTYQVSSFLGPKSTYFKKCLFDLIRHKRGVCHKCTGKNSLTKKPVGFRFPFFQQDLLPPFSVRC